MLVSTGVASHLSIYIYISGASRVCGRFLNGPFIIVTSIRTLHESSVMRG